MKRTNEAGADGDDMAPLQINSVSSRFVYTNKHGGQLAHHNATDDLFPAVRT